MASMNIPLTPDRVKSDPNTLTSTNPPTPSTDVDGQGMWRSWTRVFAKAESACLDLLDNCFDAALKQGFAGKVAMESLNSGLGIAIRNNSQTPIKRLDDALTVYKSSKNSANNGWNTGIHGVEKDAIGENGVGLKHGCATLSDCSLVFARNHKTVEIGVIAKRLQSSRGVCLPSFAFNSRDTTTNRDISGPIRKWLARNPAITDVLTEALCISVDDETDDGDGSEAPPDVNQQLEQFVLSLWKDHWNNDEHVFLLVLCNLKKSTANSTTPGPATSTSTNPKSPAKAFLTTIRNMLPQYYINLPSVGMFDFIIDQERVEFSYWQRRLVELTRFGVHVATKEPMENLDESTWDKPADEVENSNDSSNSKKYKLNIYCGFDAQRVNQDLESGQGTSACRLYIYSCQAGRLITKENDARHMLGLSSSGVDYTQGLTVIVNDITGKLPLTPTKDGIAWSEQIAGDIHHRNLIAWAGAVAQFFWTHHKSTFSAKGKPGAGSNKVKENMKNVIRSFATQEQMDTSVTVTENMEDANFTHFNNVRWKRIPSKYSNNWQIRKIPAIPAYSSIKGSDTLYTITKQRAQGKQDGNNRKRRAASISDESAANHRTTDIFETSVARRASIDEYRSEETNEWQGVPQEDIVRVTLLILAYLRDLDEFQVFESPVAETMPEIRDTYLEAIPQPMDFWTIENIRAPAYTSIAELQKDLILTFENCIQFNGASTEYGAFAQQMLGVLDDAFENATLKKRRRKKVNYHKIINQYDKVENEEDIVPYKPAGRRKKATSSAKKTTTNDDRKLQEAKSQIKKLAAANAQLERQLRDRERQMEEERNRVEDLRRESEKAERTKAKQYKGPSKDHLVRIRELENLLVDRDRRIRDLENAMRSPTAYPIGMARLRVSEEKEEIDSDDDTD